MPRLDAVTLGLSGPLRNPRHRGETRPPLRLPSRRFRPRPSTRPRLRPRSQASRPRAQQLTGFAPGTLRGRRKGPRPLGHSLRPSPSARTPAGPERARFQALSRRPLRSEKFRRVPSPGPWPRPRV
ncbi:hypothetical protein NDU88_001557 [Pleurodeles waltl]|uniref:Uncharacterized protein n=1 Tax=Pleurodeles waltl TaxID=8319 RepID=A0AAV7M0T4_PLEWA|nr:hypothetical protein NDU88_001557 [Pleurodeles waltl]